MLKSFPARVQATHAFLEVLSTWIQNHGAEVKDVRRQEEMRIAKPKFYLSVGNCLTIENPCRSQATRPAGSGVP